MRRCPLTRCGRLPDRGQSLEVADDYLTQCLDAVRGCTKSSWHEAPRTSPDTRSTYRFSGKPEGGVYHYGTRASLGYAAPRRATRYVGASAEHGETVRDVAECD